jgi:hypothetical protein
MSIYGWYTYPWIMKEALNKIYPKIKNTGWGGVVGV